jgi:Zn-dependent protease with chaperone function
MSIDFGDYITQRKRGVASERGGDHYAFSLDLKLLRTMRTFKPIELAVASSVRLGKGVLAGDLLGTAIKVGPNQYPRVHEIVKSCSETLGIPMPQVFIQGRIDSINAMTMGTDKESVIVIHSVTVDHLDDDELKFVIGHECGHIQNGHVVYLTTLRILTQVASMFLGWFVQPALIALQSWSRAAEITCDRAGLLCSGDEQVAQRAFLKLVTGSKKLYGELNVEQYLDQLREGREGLGRAAELTKSHPYIPKRIEALRLFAESEIYRGHMGRSGGRPLAEIDKAVEELVKVM